MPPFETIWNRVIGNQGNPFQTIENKEFTYKVVGNRLICSRVKYNIRKKDFELVYNIWPVNGPGAIPANINGRSYVWAVLNDERIL